MLYSKDAVRDNVRNREGKRVFYLAKGDQLTSDAKDFLTRERIAILPAEQARPERYRLLCGGYSEQKPEHMTHLNADLLVPKTHPRIAFRGMMDLLESELLLCQVQENTLEQPLGELLQLARQMIRCDVLEEPLQLGKLCGLTQEQLRSHSHRPQAYYNQPHFMPEAGDGLRILRLNRLRCITRQAELAAAKAFADRDGNPTRTDIVQGLNRMSSMLYLLMIQAKANI